MLKKIHRLDKKEFTKAFRKGRSFNLPHFVLKYNPSPHSFPRLGVSCGLRVSKKATVRNRTKRRVMEIFRHHSHALHEGDYIIIVKAGAEKESFASLRDELIPALTLVNEKNPPVSS